MDRAQVTRKPTQSRVRLVWEMAEKERRGGAPHAGTEAGGQAGFFGARAKANASECPSRFRYPPLELIQNAEETFGVGGMGCEVGGGLEECADKAAEC